MRYIVVACSVVCTVIALSGCDRVAKPQITGGNCGRSGDPQLWSTQKVQPVQSAVPVHVGVPQGSCPPMPVKALKVTCEGEGCVVGSAFRDDAKGFYVTSTKSGLVTVTASFEDEGKAKTLKTNIAFAEGRLAPLKVDKPIPPKGKVVSFMDTANVIHTCKVLADYEKDGWKVKSHKNTTIYLCYPKKEVIKGVQTYQLEAQMTDQMPTHLICMASVDGKQVYVASTTPVEVGKYKDTKTNGTLPAGASCGFGS